VNHESGTNTIFFIPQDQVPPPDLVVMYGCIVCERRPHKTEVEHTRLTVGGNIIDYPGDVSTKTTGLSTVKLIFNSVISTPSAKFMG
jgi:hypothetical protein